MAAKWTTRVVRLAAAGGFIALVTGFHRSIGMENPTTVALSLLLVVLAVATVWGLLESLVASFVAAACFNYFFLPPVGTWTIADAENWIALITFLVVSIVASQLSERVRRQARDALAQQEEKARLAEIAQRAEMVRRSEEFKSTLLDALAHELKTPLTSLKAAASALRASAIAAGQAGELVAIIEEETDRLNRLISEVLHMARIEAGKLRLNRAPCRAENLIAEALAAMRRTLDGRKVDVQVAPDIPAVSADAELLLTALRHLLDNAAKYSPAGTPVEITAARNEQQILFRVVDHGPGLSEEEQSHVFERFYRGAQAEKTSSGMGMGLSITREIMAAHGGRVWVESSPGQGCSFSFTIPAAQDGAA